VSHQLDRLRLRWDRSLAVLRAPRVRIALYGGDEAKAVYRAFTARHRVFKVTKAKRWGVALVRLPASFDEYLAGGSMKNLRYERKRAEKAGYRYALISPHDHLDEILKINQSAPTRQGRAMSGSYLDPEQVAQAFRTRVISGIFDANGHLRAYADVPAIGDAFVFSRLLGHADDLEHGIMYLLVSEVIRTYIEAAGQANLSPKWAMYDTFWGASSGLAFFKERLGFRPYTVDWAWLEPAAA
jgi:hypothetical protein